MKKKEEKKKKLIEKKANIVKFIRYKGQLQNIIKYYTLLESKGYPFLIDIVVNEIKGEIKYELVNNHILYNEFIFKLKEYCNGRI